MIQFPCKCGYAFEVPQDLAGSVIQCPQCHVLADVPLLSDLGNLNSDGTFAFEQPQPLPDPMTAADMFRAFTNKTSDGRGEEIDLRHRTDQFENIGIEQTPPRLVPRYDPVTGELIRPLPIKDEAPTPVLALAIEVDPEEVDHLDELQQPMPVLPMTAPATGAKSLAYAVGDSRKVVTPATIAIELLMPANLAVMFFIDLVFVLGYFATIGLATYTERFLLTVRPFLLLNLPMWLVFSHLGCILEDTGPDAVDEMPRPLRNFSLAEDFMSPLVRVVLAIILCFGPLAACLILLNQDNTILRGMEWLLASLGAYFFPAVVLTTVTGVTVLNLRPDRLMTVIKLAGFQYIVAVILFLLWAVPSVYYLGNELLFPRMLAASPFQRLERPLIMLPIMAAVVYFLHFFGWLMGMIYRANHADFPWIAQRHIRANE